MIFFTKGQNFDSVQRKTVLQKGNYTAQTVVKTTAILLLKIKNMNIKNVLNVVILVLWYWDNFLFKIQVGCVKRGWQRWYIFGHEWQNSVMWLLLM